MFEEKMKLSNKEENFEYGNKGFLKEDIKEAINDLIFLIDYNFIYDENSSYEEIINKEYFDVCGKYNISPYNEYSNEELKQKIIGDL